MDDNQRIATEKPFLTADRIEAALRRPLPGRAAQICMAPVPRPFDPLKPDHQPRRAGVLLLLYAAEEEGELCLVLTRRTESVADHKGQISLPGGAVDPRDPSTAHTALREACEEIGVCKDDVRLLGELTPVYIEPSDFCIEPHVAYLPRRPTFELQPDEVAELLEVPVNHFLGDDNKAVEDWIMHNPPMRVPYFDVFGHKVWGATAMVLAEFAAIMSEAAALKPT
ncbi:MAG: CoA pyrophosphatase [Syntrophorhabdales bacterium]|jgi:8-oxo-dGTP pyrophosphatase MutT (NUDIX family)